MLRTTIAVAILVAIHMLTAGCASTLDQQRRMADLAEAALVACKRDRTVCRAAKLCSSRAVEASKALQDARKATAEGRGDIGMDLDASLLVSGAEALCERAGVTSSGRMVAMPRDGGTVSPAPTSTRDLGHSADAGRAQPDLSSRVSPDLSTPPMPADLNRADAATIH